MNKLKVRRGGGGIKARRYEERIETGVAEKITKECWQEKVGYEGYEVGLEG